ncbi:LuxR family transcriptional regulator [Tengunoibacter tsumagoiensis]|uniref:LuxR family transcriptional regulator n=1 Tax=Tengunoibacter tsumagoiensis TaxID=2014871 RepID=A0A402A8Q0_9CHLR|nr:LuxR family transcriptional regulator [Tengunoibacter tsumagoiensis]
MLKEDRPRGTGYWYGYHTSSGQRRKRYLGPDGALTLARLEEMAQALQDSKQEPLQQRLLPISVPTSQADNETVSSTVRQGDRINDSGMIMTRLSPPGLPATLIIRERLLSVMDTALSCPLTLVSASAGWGKTTLLSAWVHRHPQPVAWLSLEELDNDPTRFWASLITALRRWQPEIGERSLPLLAGRSLSTGVIMLLNELVDRNEQPASIVLILDDYHVIDEPSIHASLSIFLKHLPSYLHLIISSRVDPDLPLSRLRVRGQLVEVRDTDLRFTREEAQRFLIEQMGLALEDREVALLEARTEGWIASLHLAALFLQKQSDLSAGVRMLRGNQRFLLDYLREEILASLSQDIQDFLLETSWLNPLSASLCDAVRGREDSAYLLEQVERANLFLHPLSESRQWYRYHALWAQAMQYEARLRLGASALHAFSEKASLWYEQQRMLPEAIEAALACEQFPRAATLIGRFLVPDSFHNAYHLLCSWLKRLPEEELHTQPDLCFQYALALLFTMDRRSPALWVRIEPLLQWAEQGFEAIKQREKLGEASQLHAGLAFFQGDFTQMFALARQAQPLLREESLLYADNLLLRGLASLLAGNIQEAWRQFLEGYRRTKNLENHSSTFIASLWLGEVCLEQGELPRAEHYSWQAHALMDKDSEFARQQLLLETGDLEPFFTSWAYHCLAQLSYERNDLTSAQRYLSQAQAVRAHPEEGVHLLALGAFVEVRLLHAYGETTPALDLLSHWERRTRFSWASRAIRTCRARLQLARGDLSAVEQWAWEKQQADQSHVPEQEAFPLLYQQEEALLLVRLHLAQKKGEAALDELVPWKELAQAQGRKRSVLETLILKALAHAVSQEAPQARTSLLEAVQLAQPENVQRLFLDEGPTMEHLLKTLLPELHEISLISFVRTLLRAFAEEPGARSAKEATLSPEESMPLEPLSDQEQRVLRLLVVGRSNPEIARDLVISVNTVKTHIQSIYRKMNVHNRIEASEVVRRWSLLSSS